MNFQGPRMRQALTKVWLAEKTPTGKPPAIRRLPMGTVESVVDIGAHIGMVSVLARFLHPGANVVAVEPNSDNFKQLQENTKHLGIRGLLCAVGRDSYVSFEKGSDSSSHRYETLVDGPRAGVKSYALSTLFREHLIYRQGLYLKIDIEGAEHHFLDQSDTVEIFRSCVGIDFDLHNSPEVPKTTIYREWFEKHFSETHDIEYYDGRKRGRRATAVLLRKDIPLLKHCLGD